MLAAHGAEIDLTRHLGEYEVGTALSEFVAVPGDGRLSISARGREVQTSVRLNGSDVAAAAAGPVVVELGKHNVLEVAVTGPIGSAATIRIKQVTDVELNVHSRVHFNTNVSDFAAARAFYGKLGFETLTGFPDTNTVEMAQAIGIETPTTYDGSLGDWAGGYLLHGELIGVNGFKGGVIDLIEFTIPRNDEPPYARLNHLGMASAAMFTVDLAADYRDLSAAGVEFLAAPVARSDGERFAVFRDPDGTFYRLIEVEGQTDAERPTQIVGLGHVQINVSDFERSAAWYRMLGYELGATLPPTDSTEVANAMGFDRPYEIEGAMLAHPGDDSTLELLQWITPSDAERAYDIPVNHLGIHRMAFATSDIEADVAALAAQGVEFVSPITPCCSGPDSWGSIVAFYDPDGVIVELVEQPFVIDVFMRIVRWLSG